MGILDRTDYDLKCEQCGLAEKVKVLDKGSIWRGSFWTIPNSRHFKIDWKGGEKEEPRIVKAVCNSCGMTIIS
jgi:hypothetical protein